MDLETEIRTILSELGLERLTVEIERTRTGRLGGFVISPSFAGKTQSERQDLIWDALDKQLALPKRSRIVSLLTLTPEEAAVPHRVGRAPRPTVEKKVA